MRAAEKRLSKQDLSRLELTDLDLSRIDLEDLELGEGDSSLSRRDSEHLRAATDLNSVRGSIGNGQPNNFQANRVLSDSAQDSLGDIERGDHMVFEPLQLIDKLAYLACYSQYMLSLKSDNQNYQAHLLAEALAPTTATCVLAGDVLTLDSTYKSASNTTQLFQEVAREFGLNTDHASEVGLHRFAMSQVIRPIVIVSQCEAMSDTKLFQLMSMAERTGLGLVLFSQKGLATKKSSRNMAGRILHTSVARLSTQDVKRLIRNCSHQEQQLSEVALQEVLARSGGDMQRVNPAVEEVIKTRRESLGLPLVHMSMLVLLLVVLVGGAIGGGMSIQSTTDFFSEEISIKITDLPKNLSQEQLAVEPSNTAEAVGSRSGVANQPMFSHEIQSSSISAESTHGESKSTQIGQNDALADAGFVGSDVEIVKIAEPIVLANADPNSWINDLPAPAAGVSPDMGQSKVVKGELNLGSNRSEFVLEDPVQQNVEQGVWLREAAETAYTLQILGSSDESRIQQYMAQYPSLAAFGYVETRHRSQPWFILTYGRYESRDEAVQAIDGLDADFRLQKPWARGVTSIR